MKKTIDSTRYIIMLFLKASLSIFACMGVVPTIQASAKMNPAQSQRIEDIRLRLLEYDSMLNESPDRDQGVQDEERIARWYDALNLPSWSTWNNWGNGWRNY